MRIEIPILEFLSLPLLLIPLPWHLRAKNIATCTLVITLFLVNLIRGIDSILWAGTVVVKIPVWCDITTKFIIGAQVALPATALCITRHLERVASVRTAIQTSADKRRRQIFEICLCWVFPCVIMALHYIVQGHRFDISEDFGCTATMYYSWQGILIVYVPPLALAFVSMIYASLAFYWFMKRRATFAEHLQSNDSGLTPSRYMRLMGLAIVEILLSAGFGLYVLIQGTKISPLRFYDSWADVHWDFSRIAQYPRILIPDWYWSEFEMDYMVGVIGAFVFFIFFAFGQESRAEYRKIVSKVLGSRAGSWGTQAGSQMSSGSGGRSGPILPTHSSSRVKVVKLDDLDRLSLDEKWDEADEKASRGGASSTYLGSPSSPTTTVSYAPQEPPSLSVGAPQLPPIARVSERRESV